LRLARVSHAREGGGAKRRDDCLIHVGLPFCPGMIAERRQFVIWHQKLHRRIAECTRCPALSSTIDQTNVLAAMWFIVLIGDALHLPSWILNVLPFSATPNVPYAPLTWPPLVIMTLVAGAFIWTGLRRFEHRDVQPE